MTQISETNDCIKKAVANVKSRKTRGYKLQEPDYSVALAIEFPKLMNAKQCFKNVRFGGCYIHQSPKASFTMHYKNSKNKNSVSCEIGDMLLILRKRTIDGTRYNAALFQLKKMDKTSPSISITGKATIQLYLYESWPMFTLFSKRIVYDVYPKTVTQGALYGVIKESPAFQFYVTEPMSQMTFSSDMTFARFIRDAINWQTGRSISIYSDNKKNQPDVWSKLIWDLLHHSAKKVFNRRKIKYTDCDRLSNKFFSLMLKEQVIDLGVPTDNDNLDEDDDYGISILFIDIGDKKGIKKVK